MRRGGVATVLATLLAAGCSAAADTPARTPAPAAPEPAPAAVASSPGTASPGEEAERVRFAGRIRPIPSTLAREMRGTTWKPGCPVPIRDLRLLRFNYVGFDGEVKRGPMVVHADVAADVLWVFGRLFEARFPIKRVALAREFVPEDFEAQISSRRSVTAAFNCRPVITPGGPVDRVSQHAYGLAIDLNPVQNPYVTADGFVRNRMSRPYVDRSKDLPGTIHEGDAVVRAFEAIGWSWGGRWSGDKDYMHFSRTGR